MPRGRKPKPTALKLLAGNPGQRSLNRREPKPDKKIPLCPDWMDDDAKKEWNAIVPELHRIGVLTSIDHAALAGYCQALADLKDAVHTLREEGKTTTNGQGTQVSHPAVAQKNRAMMLVHKFASEFGLTPSSRARLKTGGDEPQDDFEAFMKTA